MIINKRMNQMVTRKRVSPSQVARYKNNELLILSNTFMDERSKQQDFGRLLETIRQHCLTSQSLHSPALRYLHATLSIPSLYSTNYLVFHWP